MKILYPREFPKSYFGKLAIPFAHLFYSHFFFQSHCKRRLYSLKETRSSSVFLNLNISYIAVASPSVGPLYCSSTRRIRSVIFVEFFIEDQNACASGTAQELMRREKYRIELFHFIRRMHINIDVRS